MALPEWYELVEKIEPHVVKILTPSGSGTGFFLASAPNAAVCMVATAAHVINHAHYWEEHIRLDHETSGKSLLLRAADRALFVDEKLDTAVIMFSKDALPLPAEPFQLAPNDKHLKVGNEIGWLGYPAVSISNMCFFGGKISAWVERDQAYLVDGVAINGVSGGPAFHRADTGPVIVGVVSAYMPNRATGETLPGVAVVRSVKQFHDLAPTFQSLDQAQEKQSPPPPAPPASPLENSAQNTSRHAT